MIKCHDKGIWTCRSRTGKPKTAYNDDTTAISAAKIVNEKYKNPNTKLVAYKCTHCYKYHLLTVNKKRNK